MSLLLVGQGGVVDEDDGWWAGVQGCFTAIPIAGALAAVALSASLAFGYQQQTEEIVPQAAVAGGAGSSAVALPFQDVSFIVTPWVDDTEFPVVVAPVVENESPPLAARPVQPVVITPWVTDDDLPVRLEEEYWWQESGATALTASSASLWALADDLPQQQAAAAAVEDEGAWRPPVFLTETRVDLGWASHGQTDPVTSPPIVAEDVAWQDIIPLAPPSVVTVTVWATDEVLLTAIEEEYWWAVRRALASPPFAFPAWHTDELPQQVAAAAIDEDVYGWWSAARVPPRPLTPVWATTDETVPVAPTVVEASYWWWQARWLVPSVITPAVAEDEELPSEALPSALVEDDWWSEPLRLIAPVVALSTADEIIPLFTIPPPIVMDEYWWQPPTLGAPPLARPWVVDDEWSPGVVPGVSGTPDPSIAVYPSRDRVAAYAGRERVTAYVSRPRDGVYDGHNGTATYPARDRDSGLPKRGEP